MKATYRNRAQALNGAYVLVRDAVRRKLAQSGVGFVRAEAHIAPLPNGRWQVDVRGFGGDVEPAARLVMHGVKKETA